MSPAVYGSRRSYEPLVRAAFFQLRRRSRAPRQPARSLSSRGRADVPRHWAFYRCTSSRDVARPAHRLRAANPAASASAGLFSFAAAAAPPTPGLQQRRALYESGVSARRWTRRSRRRYDHGRRYRAATEVGRVRRVVLSPRRGYQLTRSLTLTSSSFSFLSRPPVRSSGGQTASVGRRPRRGRWSSRCVPLPPLPLPRRLEPDVFKHARRSVARRPTLADQRVGASLRSAAAGGEARGRVWVSHFTLSLA